jgi:hypothetical protein
MSVQQQCWSWSFGDWGSRVRVVEREENGILYLLWTDGESRQRRRSLGHKDKSRAKREAREISEGRTLIEGGSDIPLTVGTLIDIFMARGLVGRSKPYVSDKRRQLERWKKFLGESKSVRSLSPSDVQAFMVHRNATSEKSLSATTHWHDWKALDIALNFATRERNSVGNRILESNPLSGQVKLPKTTSPARPIASGDYFRALWEVREQLPWQFEVALILARETGHRIGAIL